MGSQRSFQAEKGRKPHQNIKPGVHSPIVTTNAIHTALLTATIVLVVPRRMAPVYLLPENRTPRVNQERSWGLGLKIHHVGIVEPTPR